MLSDLSQRTPAPNGSRAAITLGMLVDWLEDDYQTVVLEGAAEAARQRGANLICFAGGALGSPQAGLEGSVRGSSRRFGARRNAIYDLVSPDCVDGLMILSGTLGNNVGPGELVRFCERYRPLPMCSIAVTLPGMPCVLVDNAAGMRAAVAHLIVDHGFRRIAFIRGPLANEEAERRYRIYRDVLAEYRVGVDPRLVVAGDFQRASGFDAVRELFDERKVQVDAIVGASDYMALGAMDALSLRGLLVPRDVAVVGFDDIEEARSEIPPLTTVRQPLFDQGHWAAEALLDLIQGRPTPERVVLHTEFVRRRSCGCPRSIEAQPNGDGSEADVASELSMLEHAVSVQAGQRLAARRFARALAETGETLSSALDFESLGHAMSERLPRLGIGSGYVSVYDRESHPTDAARLVISFSDGRLDLEENRVFRCRELVPASARIAGRRFSWVVEPLFFEDEQLGFAVLDFGSSDGVVYEALRDQISAAMKTALLVKRTSEAERERKRLLRFVLEAAPELFTPRPLEELALLALRHAVNLVFSPEAAVDATAPPAVSGFLAVREGDGNPVVVAGIGRFLSDDSALSNLPAEALAVIEGAVAAGEVRSARVGTAVPIAIRDTGSAVLFFDAELSGSSDVEFLEAFARPLSAALAAAAIHPIAAERTPSRSSKPSSRAAGRSSSD